MVAVTPLPAAAAQLPAVALLNPGRRAVVISPTLALPMAGHPGIAVVAVVPIAWGPDVALTGRRRPLMAWRGRGHPDIDALCKHGGGEAGRGGRQHGDSGEFSELHGAFSYAGNES